MAAKADAGFTGSHDHVRHVAVGRNDQVNHLADAVTGFVVDAPGPECSLTLQPIATWVASSVTVMPIVEPATWGSTAGAGQEDGGQHGAGGECVSWGAFGCAVSARGCGGPPLASRLGVPPAPVCALHDTSGDGCAVAQTAPAACPDCIWVLVSLATCLPTRRTQPTSRKHTMSTKDVYIAKMKPEA